MEPIPIRMLNEIQYCERLFHLMHVQGLFEESADTVEGKAQHERAEKRRRPGQMAPDELWGQAPRSLRLGDEQYMITGVLDTIKHEDGQWVPVEAKHSSAPDGSQSFHYKDYELDGSAWPNDQIQLCAQGLLLRANGYPCTYGYLFYRGNRKKVKIPFSETLVAVTLECINRAHELTKMPEKMPKPLIDSQKCFRCSLNYICLPDETNYLQGASSNVRKIVPQRMDGGVLYVSEPGARLGKSGEELIIQFPDGSKNGIPIKDLVHVSIFGNVQCSEQLLQTLMFSNITVSHLTTHGTLVGLTSPPVSKNIFTRRKQFLKFTNQEFSLRLAKKIVYAKIRNQRTLLRRNLPSNSQNVLDELKRWSEKVESVDSLDALLGIEGMAAKAYFAAFPSLLKTDSPLDFAMNGRQRRPPKDPVNALLSLGYTLLVRDIYAACASSGLDPMYGFYHRPEAGRPALVLDMMEPFRPIIVDSVVLRALNTGEISLKDFYFGKDSCLLKKSGRDTFFGIYERRMHDKITDPIFGYKISYRRILDLHMRMLARFVDGELPEYRPLMPR
jgi:CRISPR-associated protein Cas1